MSNIEQPIIYDAVIIGGGPGGSTAGAFLGRAGRKALILEKERFPRFHVGESLLPVGNDVLKASGAWEKIEKAGFMPKLGAEFCSGNGGKARGIWFSHGLIPGYDRTFQVERSKFDELLFRHAHESGCETLEEATVETVNFDSEGASVTYKVASGMQTVRCRYVIDASGQNTFLGRHLNLPKEEVTIPKRTATFGHYKGVYRNPGDAAGHITAVRLAGGWFWLIPLDSEKTSVGMVQEVESLRKSGLSPEEMLDRTIGENSNLRARFKDASRLTNFHTISNYTYFYKVQGGPRMLLIGDSGGFVDPIFSSGVLIATRSGQMASELIVSAGGRNFTSGEIKKFGTGVSKMRKRFNRMIENYYCDHGFAVFSNPQTRLRITDAVNSLVAGHTTMTFAQWWRVEIFFLVCKLQRWFAMVPRVDFSEKKM